MKTVTVVTVLLAVIVAVAVLSSEPAKAPPCGIDRFNYSWTAFDCPTGGCPTTTLYVPSWCPDPYCEECGAPLDPGSSLGYGAVPSGARLLWLAEFTK